MRFRSSFSQGKLAENSKFERIGFQEAQHTRTNSQVEWPSCSEGRVSDLITRR